jgi:hypothetical protein
VVDVPGFVVALAEAAVVGARGAVVVAARAVERGGRRVKRTRWVCDGAFPFVMRATRRGKVDALWCKLAGWENRACNWFRVECLQK